MHEGRVGETLALVEAVVFSSVEDVNDGIDEALVIAETVIFDVVDGMNEAVETGTGVDDEPDPSCAASAAAIEDKTERSIHEVEELP